LKTPSLRNRLLIQLAPAQVLAVAVAWLIVLVTSSIDFYGHDMYLWEYFAYYRIRNLVGQSAARSADGALRVIPNAELQAEIDSNPTLQFAAFDAMDRPAAKGSSVELATALERVRSVDVVAMEFFLKSDPSKRHLVSLWPVHTSVGKLDIAVRGGAFKWSDPLLALFDSAPHLAVQLGFVFVMSALVSLLVIRRSLAPLRRTADAAENIRMDTLGQGLRADGAPSEILPLVAAVNRALTRLDASAERMRRYIANAAHELRTPVAILRARVENAADSPFKAELRRDVKKIQAIIDQLLISARLAENQAALAQEVDLVRAARYATADYSPLVFVSGRRIAFEAETARLPIRANAQAVGCVIGNLIDNALRAEPEGGTVLVRVRRDAVVEVVDHGAGVALQDRGLIFEPFWRKSEDGSGLGLAISKELIEKLGGRIRVRETPQGGATFELQFQKSESGGGEGVRA
jgi:signal transduction histidine kinase